MPDINIFPFEEECECEYKGEHYSVRDNGAIMRHPIGKKRPLDGRWTFGEKDNKNGYMVFRGERVHRIVATAFHGPAPSEQHVVDHIDTNRSNNRPENLRWLTRLENILLNENTLNKVIYICGSLEAFLENPQLLFGHELEDTNFTWMRTVTPEEAKATRENMTKLATRPQDVPSKGAHVGDWIFKLQKNEWQHDFSKRDVYNIPSKQSERLVEPLTVKDLKFTGAMPYETWDVNKEWGSYKSQTLEEDLETENEDVEDEQPTMDCYKTNNELAVQQGWQPHTQPAFPCCPHEVSDNPLQEYDTKLTDGAVFVTATYGSSTVYKHIVSNDQLLVITKIPNGVKNFGLTRITWDGTVFIHESMGTFFEENGALAAFTRAQGLEWNGTESIDDYC